MGRWESQGEDGLGVGWFRVLKGAWVWVHPAQRQRTGENETQGPFALRALALRLALSCAPQDQWRPLVQMPRRHWRHGRAEGLTRCSAGLSSICLHSASVRCTPACWVWPKCGEGPLLLSSPLGLHTLCSFDLHSFLSCSCLGWLHDLT